MGILSILLANVAASGLSLLLLIPTIQSRFARVDSGLWKKMILFGLPVRAGRDRICHDGTYQSLFPRGNGP